MVQGGERRHVRVPRKSTWWSLATVVGVGIVGAGCGSEDPTAGVVATPNRSTAPDATGPDASVIVASATPRADPSGTIVISGATHEVSGRSIVMTDDGAEPGDGDFGICDAGGSLRPDDLSVVVLIGDDEFSLSVRDGAPVLRFGEPLVSDDMTGLVEYNSDGTRVTGVATLPQAGTIEFDVVCP